MDQTEKEFQKALGLIHKWDVYVRFVGDTFYTIYTVEAPTKKEAFQIGLEKIKATGRKIKQFSRKKKQKNFVEGPDPITVWESSVHAK